MGGRKSGMHALQDVLQRVQKDGIALGHFNISDFVQLKAVFSAAQKLEVPVLVGASEGEREFFGVRQIAHQVVPYKILRGYSCSTVSLLRA
jgi:fructose/tagatose bisphosphate aldolase